jgi:hypothetical protein
VTEHHFPAEELEVRVLQPAVAQSLVGQIVHVLENEQPSHQPRRQRRMAGPFVTHRAEAPSQEIPIDLRGQPHQRMAEVDDLIQRWTKQVVLAIVARLAHRSPSTANLIVEGITNRSNPESQNARKPGFAPGFLAKSNTSSTQISLIRQLLLHSSRTTSSNPPSG